MFDYRGYIFEKIFGPLGLYLESHGIVSAIVPVFILWVATYLITFRRKTRKQYHISDWMLVAGCIMGTILFILMQLRFSGVIGTQ